MWRKEKFPYSHFVDKTRTNHGCAICKLWIPAGAAARYKNLFTGKRGYIHNRPDCNFFKEINKKLGKYNKCILPTYNNRCLRFKIYDEAGLEIGERESMMDAIKLSDDYVKNHLG